MSANRPVAIQPGSSRDTGLVLHPEKAAELGLRMREPAFAKFGCVQRATEIRLDSSFPLDVIQLSPFLIRALQMPEYPTYEVRVHGDEITFGPCIGLLISREDARLTPSRLTKMLVALKSYDALHGTIIAFALDQVDRTNRLIGGYGYHPAKRYWERGIFPYPAAIYRTIGLSPEWKNHFRSAIGNTLFNSRFFGKWEMVRWFRDNPAIAPHLPRTTLYRSPKDVMAMLDRFGEVYIKPVLGLQGRGIVRVSGDGGRWLIKTRKNGVNSTAVFNDPSEARRYLREQFHHGKYLVQQAVDLLQYKEGLVDFRCVMQKDQANAWICRAVIGRVGVKSSIVSNISSGGTAYPGENLLRRMMSGAEAEAIHRRIEKFALAVCAELDERGINCGTLGLDIGLDVRGDLWLIEINNRDPDPGIALDIHDTPLYYTLKAGPLFYAKYLAGFGEEIPPPQPDRP